MPGTVRWSWECPSWARVFTRGLAPSVCEEDLNQKTTENNEQREEIIRLKQEKSSLGDELLCTGKAAGSPCSAAAGSRESCRPGTRQPALAPSSALPLCLLLRGWRPAVACMPAGTPASQTRSLGSGLVSASNPACC